MVKGLSEGARRHLKIQNRKHKQSLEEAKKKEQDIVQKRSEDRLKRMASKDKEYKESYIGSFAESLPGSFLGEDKSPEKYDTYGKQSTTIQEVERMETDHIEELVATSKK